MVSLSLLLIRFLTTMLASLWREASLVRVVVGSLASALRGVPWHGQLTPSNLDKTCSEPPDIQPWGGWVAMVCCNPFLSHISHPITHLAVRPEEEWLALCSPPSPVFLALLPWPCSLLTQIALHLLNLSAMTGNSVVAFFSVKLSLTMSCPTRCFVVLCDKPH